MLTATYAIVTLTVEQKKARGTLSKLHQQIRNKTATPEAHDRSAYETILYQLVQFDESCHWRNIELYVMPALRNASTEADELISKIESLSSHGENILRDCRAHLRRGFVEDVEEVARICKAMDSYCRLMMERMDKEEHELLPIAQHVISSKDWFDLAAQFISHDAEIHAHKPIAPSGRHAIGLIQHQSAMA
ncbi:hypothetical protein BH11PSE11_BH11PSE11_20150 [soil metagenome]